MARVGSVFVCSMCDEKISDETFSCKLRKGNAYVSGVLDCVQKTSQGKKVALTCSCGENVGEFIASKKELKYCLDLEKVRRCTVRNSERSDAESICPQKETAPLPTDLVAPPVSKKIYDACNKSSKNSTVCREEAEKVNEIMQLKQRIATLEEVVKSVERENAEKLKDVCGMLLSQKLEIQRLQEIIWVLHPNMNLDHAFTVDDKALYFGSDPDISIGDLNVDED